MTPQDVLTLIKDEAVKFVDLRFTDTRGKEQHVSVPSSEVDAGFFTGGLDEGCVMRREANREAKAARAGADSTRTPAGDRPPSDPPRGPVVDLASTHERRSRAGESSCRQIRPPMARSSETHQPPTSGRRHRGDSNQAAELP